jgi:hypothetical protein
VSEEEFDENRILPDPQNSYIVYYIQETTNNRDSARSAQFLEKIFKYNYPQENLSFFNFLDKYYGEFLKRLMKKSVRYMLNNEPWELVELKLRDSP